MIPRFIKKEKWKSEYGNRRNVIVIPKRRKPVDGSFYKPRDIDLAFRIKKEYMVRYNFTCRAQNTRRVAEHFYAITIEDLWYLNSYPITMEFCMIKISTSSKLYLQSLVTEVRQMVCG